MNQRAAYLKTWRKNNPQWIVNYRKRNKEKIKRDSRDRYLRNKEQYDKSRKLWYKKNKKRILQNLREKKQTIEGKICEWKKGALRRGIEWQLTTEFIKSLPLVCSYTGKTLTLVVGFPNTLSLDRVDSSRPYSDDNVVPCCSMVNTMKSMFDRQDFINMCHEISKHNSK